MVVIYQRNSNKLLIRQWQLYKQNRTFKKSVTSFAGMAFDILLLEYKQ